MRTVALALAIACVCAGSQQAEGLRPTLAPRATIGIQVSDTAFEPRINSPAFQTATAPLVLLDEAHENFHTVDGRYAPFVKLLRRDGLRVEPLRSKFTAGVFQNAGILVIANALGPKHKDQWTLPAVAAFSADEVQVVRDWVSNGGSLLLIADHMPFPGAAANLARAFGFLFTNGFATDSAGLAGDLVFRRADGTLLDDVVTRGRTREERVDSIVTFTGQAFRAPPGARPILSVPRNTMILLPQEAGKFSETTAVIPADGMLQGAVLEFGRGRVAVFGEAAMFSAQVSGPERRPMGMNVPAASQNAQLLLNIMRWLAKE